ncbi:glycosyltransferase family 8 protein [Micromonospora schwarzwaldensis]|uniref:glycosyltransferase family 8 protein n=1 Tax=Micromonospora sp. DSM 45708 TaxID=3111767 RepID=UPI0031DBD8D8
MHIGMAFDEKYADYAAVTIESILATRASAEDEVTFWILPTPDVGASTFDRMVECVSGRAAINFLDSTDAVSHLPGSVMNGLEYISSAMYLRLLLADLVPDEVDRILYLDTDILCTGDLRPLYDTELNGAPLAAVRDAFTLTFAHNGGIPGLDEEEVGSLADRKYFNSGVLLIDVASWRNNGFTERCIRYLEQNAGKLRYPDQDALNVVFDGIWHELPKIWNEMESHELEWVGRSLTEARLLHFAGPYKPWQKDFPDGPRLAAYHKYMVQVGLIGAQTA